MSARLRLPAAARACYVLAHGAGAGMDHPFMRAAADELCALGIATLRYQFPYMERRARRPDPPPLCHATVRAAVAAGGAPRRGTAAVRRGALLRRTHDLAGAGARAAARGTRAGVPRFPAASGRAAFRHARAAPGRGAHSDAVRAGHARCARRTRAHRGAGGAARSACDPEAQSRTRIIPSTFPPAADARTQRSEARCCARWRSGWTRCCEQALARSLRREAQLHAHARAARERGDRAPRSAAVRGAEARGAAAALRLSPRARRGAQVLGGAQGSLARSQRQAHGGRGRGPSVRLRLLRGRDPGEAVRRRQCDRVGLRRVLPGRGPQVLLRRPRRGAGARAHRAHRRQAELHVVRGEAQGLLHAGEDPHRQPVAAHQAPGRLCPHQRRAGAARLRSLGPEPG